jgi:hypothetical protein
LHRCRDSLDHTGAIFHHVMIIEAKHAIPLGGEKRVTSRVALFMLRLEMLRAVDL